MSATTRQRGQPDEAVHTTRLRVLLAASSAQHLTPSRLTICVGAVFVLYNMAADSADPPRLLSWPFG
jgi:hypothetical protein